MSSSFGKSYGLELLAQQKLSTSVYGIFAFTYYKSEFSNVNKNLIPSSWDNRFILNMTAGKKFKRNIEIGVKFRYSGGSPYTPVDYYNSSIKEIWDINQSAVLDYDLINTLRLKNTHGIDFRIDKRWFFNKWSINAYIDIENLYNSKVELPPQVGIDPELGEEVDFDFNSNQYQLYEILNETGTVLPSIGLLIEF